MSEAGVTRVAIVIFALVIASVIEARVAGFGVAVIALVLVDQLGCRGRFSGLLQAWVAYQSPDYQDRILHHEAGHLVAACVLDIPVVDYVLNPWQAFLKGYPGYGGVQLDLKPFEDWIQTQTLSQRDLDRYGLFWMAGPMAEQLHMGDTQGDSDDKNTILHWLSLLRRQSGVALDPHQHIKRFQAAATELLATHPQAYNVAVTQMQQQLPIADCIHSIKMCLED